MKHLSSIIVGLAISAGVINAGAVVTMQELIDTGGTLTAGPITFGNFGYGTATGPGADLITVAAEAATTLPDTYNIRFGGPMFAGDGGLFDPIVDVEITYSAWTASPIIVGIDQAFNLSALGAGGTVIIGETVTDGAFFVAQSTVGWQLADPDFTDPPGEVLQGDFLGPFAPESFLVIDKDIGLIANRGGTVGASTVYQSFHVVPEPHEFALAAGLGLLGFAAFRKKGCKKGK